MLSTIGGPREITLQVYYATNYFQSDRRSLEKETFVKYTGFEMKCSILKRT